MIERPVPGVVYSLQQDDKPLDLRASDSGESLAFNFPLRIERPSACGAKFFGPQVRREGKVRRFVYVRIGTSAGQHGAPWDRRIKVDIHDIEPALLDAAIAGGLLEATIRNTARDGSPACATIRPVHWRVAEAT